MVVQYIRKTVVFLLAAALISTACVREDLSECEASLTLTFHYTHNITHTDLFTNEVDRVTLFIYDVQGKLVKQETVERQDMLDGNRHRLTLPVGEYRVVAYGNARESYDYKFTHNYYEALNFVHRDAMGQVAPTIETLFYGTEDKLTISGQQEQEHKIFFHKNSNLVRVILRSTNPAETFSDMECKISAINGDYKFDNTIYGNDRVHYIPFANKKAVEPTYTFNLLRLWEGDDSILSVVDQATDAQRTWYDGSLTALLLKKPGTDLDLEDTFEVILTLDTSNSTVKITVNDWEVIDHNSGL